MSDKIKMSDAFALPVKQDGRKCMREADGDFLFLTNKEEGEAAAIAINAYDDNQQGIAELKAIIESMRESLNDIMVSCEPIQDVLIQACFDVSKTELNKTPTQCLTIVKADAVKEMVKSISSTVVEGKVYLASIYHYEDKLREQK